MGKQKLKETKSKKENKYKGTVTKKKQKVKGKKKVRKNVPNAKVTISCSYNNSIITFSDYSGNVFAWSSCGAAGFRGSKKGTAYAATKAAYDAYNKASRFGVQEASVVVKGVGMGRKAAVKGLRSAGLIITSLSDETPVAHGGCRPRKKPRGS